MSKMKSASGHKATHHHKIHQKTSLLLALLIPFFLFDLIRALGGGYDGFISWISAPFGAISLLAFVSIGLYQSKYSMDEIIMDYASSEAVCGFFIKLNAFVCFIFWLIAVVAILKIWLLA